MKIENAKITSTSLGNEDHGIFSAYVTVEGDGWGCSFGGYAMDSYSLLVKKRIGTAFGTQFIMDLLETLGVESWEKLKGQHVRVQTEGLGGGITCIGHLIKDRWFDPLALAEKMKNDCAQAAK